MNTEEFDHPRLASEIQKCFSKREIEGLARSSKFIQRSTSRLSGMDFILMNVFDSSNGKERSLSECCTWLEENRGIELKKQSLDERYNTDSVRFMRMCLSRVIEMVNGNVVEEKSKTLFSGIYLTDSTSFRIPDPLSSFYEGGGSKSGDAMIKIHLSYNLLDGKVKDIGIRSGKEADGTYLSSLEKTIIEGALYIRDLGYYSLSHYELISKKQAYFLSRGKADAVYTIKTEKGFERVNFLDLLPKKNDKIEHDNIYVGARKTKLQCRLIIESVPQEVVAKRLKKLERLNSKHTKWNISEMRKRMCHYNVYITNATKEQLPTKTVRKAYKLRWQIELVFKIWKSVFDIDKVKKMSIFRFECYLYSKLIAIFLTLHIQNRFSNYLWGTYEFEMSPIKAAKLIKKKLKP